MTVIVSSLYEEDSVDHQDERDGEPEVAVGQVLVEVQVLVACWFEDPYMRARRLRSTK